MKREKFIKATAIFLAVLMLLSVVISVVSTMSYAAPSKSAINALEKEQKALQQKMQEIKAKINSLEYQQLAAIAKKEVLDERIALTQQEIENLNEQIDEYGVLIEEKEEEVREYEELEAEQWELYKTRMRAMEENGVVTYYAIIFGASSFSDMLARLDQVSEIMEHDKGVYEDLLAAQEATEQAKSSLEATKAELETKREELIGVEATLQEEIYEANDLVISIEESLEESEALYRETSQEEADIQEDIKKMEEELKKLEESQRVQGTGSFIWPSAVSRKVTSLFGMREHPVYGYYRNHNGIDIGGAAYGTNILAADGGTVITSATSNSYGEYVVISHGNGYTTLYAHMSKRLVSKGDTVKQGDVIGRVGSTGISTGPHIHFEISYLGERQNPLNYYRNYYLSDGCW